MGNLMRSLFSTPVAVVGGAIGVGIVIYALTISGDTPSATDVATPAAITDKGAATDNGGIATGSAGNDTTATPAQDNGANSDAGEPATAQTIEGAEDGETLPVSGSALPESAEAGTEEQGQTPADQNAETSSDDVEVAQTDVQPSVTELEQPVADATPESGTSEGGESDGVATIETASQEETGASPEGTISVDSADTPAQRDAEQPAQMVSDAADSDLEPADSDGAIVAADDAAEASVEDAIEEAPVVGDPAPAPAEETQTAAVAENQAAPMAAAVAPDIEEPAGAATIGETQVAILDSPRPATQQVDPVEATQNPEQNPSLDGGASQQPQAIVLAPSPATESGIAAPKFDLVRVDKTGATIVAGKAEPNTEVEVLQDGQVVATVTSSARGEFVALFDSDVQEQAQSLELASRSEDGGPQVFSESSVIVLGRVLPQIEDSAGAVAAVSAPAVIQATPDEVRVLQPLGGLADLGNISLDSISYDSKGEVVLAGRGKAEASARAYANDRFVGEAVISNNGSWRIKLEGLEAGRYILRVDEVTGDGSVSSRVESPFQRVYPSAENLEALSAQRQVVIQRGDNLWNIAEVRFGDGFKYTVIYDANVDQIRDPDLIFPGQIFDVPNSETGADDE